MPFVPVAAFLAGALLTLLLPIALLIALVVWYWLVSVRASDTSDGPDPNTPTAAAANPGPNVAETLPPEHRA